jgi:hypothetical protein
LRHTLRQNIASYIVAFVTSLFDQECPS